MKEIRGESPRINVVAFGARGFDTFDSSAFVVDAKEWRDEHGGTLYFPPGRFKIGSDITLNGAVELADGAILIPANGATVIYSGSGELLDRQYFDVSLGGAVSFVGTDRLEIRSIWYGAEDDPTAVAAAVAAAAAAGVALYAPGHATYPLLVGEVAVTHLEYPYGDPRRHGAVLGGADDTMAVSNALASAVALGIALSHPGGDIAISSVAYAGPVLGVNKLVSIKGTGKTTARFVRHDAAVNTQTSMFTFDWCDVVVEGVSFDHARPAAMSASTAACLDIYKGNVVRVRDCGFSHGQYHGLKISACNDVVVTGNSFYQNFYDGIGIGGGLKVTDNSNGDFGCNRVVITGNTFDTNYGAIIAQVYINELVITDNAITAGSIQIGQGVQRLAISGNTVEGSNETYGVRPLIPATPVGDGIFLEDPYDAVVSGNVLRGMAGKGIYATGSELNTAPDGPLEGTLPLKRLIISGNVAYQCANTGILVNALSSTFGVPGPAENGDTILVASNLVSECSTGIAFANVNGGAVNANYVSLSVANGVEISGGKYVTLSGNTILDNSTAGDALYYGVQLDTDHPTVSGNTIADTRDTPWQRAGILDYRLNGGTASNAKYNGNTFSRNVVGAILPFPAIPTSGTWEAGDIIQNTQPTAGGYMGWVCVVAGTPGTWKGFGAIAA